MANIEAIKGDCLEVLDNLPHQCFDLIYLDPPFFTQRHHSLTTRDGHTTFGFHDIWASPEEYALFLYKRVTKLHEHLADTGSLFFHCDRNASHIVRSILEQIFGPSMFQSEIIWTYRKWSNSSKGLLPAHQTIFFYSKSPRFKFHHIYTDYSESTNLDQITQKRGRDERNKSVYAKDENGDPINQGVKKGVPLGDVWDIPLLNPKAKERVGYPTQKPILLMEQILNLCTDVGDWVLDPFCGSGTTLLASQFLGRNAIGIDVSETAIELTKSRLSNSIKTESRLLTTGRSNYSRGDAHVLEHMKDVEHFVVQRNNGIDAILKKEICGKPAYVRVQRDFETLSDAISAFRKAVAKKGPVCLILIVTHDNELPLEMEKPSDIHLVHSPALAIKAIMNHT